MQIKNSIKIATLSIVASVLFVGCGSGGSSSSNTSSGTVTQTGTFADAPVQGLHYTTATQNGFTDGSGHFKYKTDEEVTFKLGNLLLGKGKAATLVTPYTISDNNTTATNIALLLQNFDGNRSNGNILDMSKLKDYNFTSDDINLSAPSSTIKAKIDNLFADNNFAQYRDENNNSVIDSTTAKEKMDNYLNKLKSNKATFTTSWLAGKTFYWAIPEESQIIKMDFKKAGQMQWTSVNDGVSTVPYTIDSNTSMEFTPDYPDTCIVDKFVLIDSNTTGLSVEHWNISDCNNKDKGPYMMSNEKLFYNVQDANTILKTEQNANLLKNGFTKAYLNGKTFYQIYIGEADVTSYTFSNTVTFIDENHDSSTYKQELTGFQAGDGVLVVKDGKLYEFTYTMVNGSRAYNDGINIYTITSIDKKKITTSVLTPGGTVYTANWYFHENDAN